MSVIKDSGRRAILLPFAEEHEELRETVSRFVSKEIAPHVEEWEAAREFPRELYNRCGELGFLGLKFPEEYGGQGGTHIHDAVWVEELSRSGASGGVGAGLNALSTTLNQVNDRREIFGWTMYDWANSAFSTTVVAALLGPYLTALAQNAVGENGVVMSLGPFGVVTAKSLFPYATSLSVFLQVFLLPVLGAIADYSNLKKRLMAVFCYIGVGNTDAAETVWLNDMHDSFVNQ